MSGKGAAKKVTAAMKGCAETAKSLTVAAKQQKQNDCRTSNAKNALATSRGKDVGEVDEDKVNES